MPWFYVDDAFADSKPVMRLDERLRNEAVGLWVRCGAWSAKEETDGRVPLDVVRQFGGNKRLVLALANDAELWAPLDDDENWRKTREILFKNWEKWQKTKAENERRRKQEAEKKRTYRSQKKGRDYVSTSGDAEMSTGDTAPDTSGDSKTMSTRDSRDPDPTRPLVVTNECVPAVGNANGPARAHTARPSEFCDRHPGGTRARCGDCANARRNAEAWDRARAEKADIEAIARVNERQRELDRLHGCPLCDSAGWVIDPDPDAPARKCTHPTPIGATP